MKVWSLVALLCLSATAARGASPITSAAIGIFQPDEKVQLAPAFTNAVYDYLRRYRVQLVSKSADYVKMRVRYDYDYDVEFRIKDNTYEIVVTLAQKVYNLDVAQKDSAHLAAGILKSMQKWLVPRDR